MFPGVHHMMHACLARPSLAAELDGLHEKMNGAYGKLAAIITKLEMDRMDSAGIQRQARIVILYIVVCWWHPACLHVYTCGVSVVCLQFEAGLLQASGICGRAAT